jgi:transposase-like protein
MAESLTLTRNYSKKQRAAMLVAEGDLTDEQISSEVGIVRKTLHNWKRDPDFAAEVGDHIGQIQAGMLRLAIAKKHKRVERLDEMERRLWQVVEERAADYAAKAANESTTMMRGIFPGSDDAPPGSGTGLVTKTIKQIGAGRSAQMIEEYGVATDLVRSIMSLHEQAAKELGQWIEKSASEVTTSVVQIVGIDADDL